MYPKTFILILIVLNSTSPVFAQNCIYVKKVEYKNDKIINSITEYNCNTTNKNEGVNLKSRLSIDNIYASEPKTFDVDSSNLSKSIKINKNYEDTTYLSSRPITYTEYLDMVYYNNNYNQISDYQPKGLVGQIFKAFARIILLQ